MSMKKAKRLMGALVASRWWMASALVCGAAAGLGLAVVHVARATSYLSDSPETCVNCHVMRTEYASWRHSSHAGVATCNDCHVPHDNWIHAYAFKARDGMYHASIFTLRLEPQVIHMSSAAVPVVEANCRRCHADVVCDVSLRDSETAGVRCWHCHRNVPHGTARGLSSASDALNPELSGISTMEPPKIGGRRPWPPRQTPARPDAAH